MQRLTKEQIAQINRECPHGQGVYFEGYGVPVQFRGQYTVYTKYETGGWQGGSCWGDEAEPFACEEPDDKWKVLDLVLAIVSPNISYLDYKYVLKLIDDNEDTDYEYYGNSTDWKVEFIPLEKLYGYFKI